MNSFSISPKLNSSGVALKQLQRPDPCFLPLP